MSAVPKDGTEEIWGVNPDQVTPDSYTVHYHKQKFRGTRTIPEGLDVSQPDELIVGFSIKDAHVVMTKISIVLVSLDTVVILKQWDEVSDYVVTHCK